MSSRFATAIAAASAGTILALASSANAESCATQIGRSNLVACALASSLAVRADEREIDAAEARKVAVSPLLPSNPVLHLSGANRSAAGHDDVFNWDATLSQEVEIAGQRGARREAAQAEVDAREKRKLLSQRNVAARAWLAYFDAVSARADQELAERLLGAAQKVADVARARSESGLIAGVDADVADAAAVRALRAKLASDRNLAGANAKLASLVGADPTQSTLRIDGDLAPLTGIDQAAAALVPNAVALRPEVAALDAEQKALELRADAYRRTRIPNPTVSVFAENDGFNERVLGVGLAFPIPLPGNVGRTYKGEIAEADALASRVGVDRESARREIRLNIVTAAQAYASLEKEVQAFTAERITRADQSLRSLGQEAEAGHLSVRDAVVSEQALIELLQSAVTSRRALCITSVELALAAGIPLERGTQ